MAIMIFVVLTKIYHTPYVLIHQMPADLDLHYSKTCLKQPLKNRQTKDKW